MTVHVDQAGFVYDVGTPWEARALHTVDLEIDAGSRLLVTGPNGSGKSTLAWLLAGHLEPTEGRVLVEGRPATESITTTGFLLQHSRLQVLAPTVGEDGRRFGIDRADHVEALETMGLDASMLGRKIDEMSLGQQRRVALAGLLARRCPLLVLDEPLAGLDMRSVGRLIEAVADLGSATTVVTITHDIETSADLGNRIVTLEDGRIITDRTPTNDDTTNDETTNDDTTNDDTTNDETGTGS